MVYEVSGDGASVHWRVVDVSTGEVLSEGDAGPACATPRSPLRTARRSRWRGTPARSSPSTSRPETNSGDPPASVPRCCWLDYSDDGELLVSGADDGGVSLWDATTLDLLGTVYPPHQGDPVPAGAQFIGDSHDVAIASYDGRVYRWETDLDRAIDFACQMAGRNLTEEEWEEFLPAQPYQSVCPDE